MGNTEQGKHVNCGTPLHYDIFRDHFESYCILSIAEGDIQVY
jgi:hypothetical protein